MGNLQRIGELRAQLGNDLITVVPEIERMSLIHRANAARKRQISTFAAPSSGVAGLGSGACVLGASTSGDARTTPGRLIQATSATLVINCLPDHIIPDAITPRATIPLYPLTDLEAL